MALAPAGRTICCLGGVWIAERHPTVVARCLKGRCRVGRVVCYTGCPPVIQAYKAGMTYKSRPRPRSTAAGGVSPHVAELTVAYQGFANGVDHQVGVVLCSYHFSVADIIGAVGACRDMLVVRRVVVGCIRYRICCLSVVVNLCSILLRWRRWSYPCGGAGPNVPKER